MAQLEKNLSALGYDGFTVDDTYSSSTASAVREWQEDLGVTETGRVELGQVVFASGAVRVDSVTATLGQPLNPGGEVLKYTGTARVVTLRLSVADQRLARKGTKVQVKLPRATPWPARCSASTRWWRRRPTRWRTPRPRSRPWCRWRPRRR
ncbi:peptidoglycan-binding domain-containing protein [Luedemannella flava]